MRRRLQVVHEPQRAVCSDLGRLHVWGALCARNAKSTNPPAQGYITPENKQTATSPPRHIARLRENFGRPFSALPRSLCVRGHHDQAGPSNTLRSARKCIQFLKESVHPADSVACLQGLDLIQAVALHHTNY